MARVPRSASINKTTVNYSLPNCTRGACLRSSSSFNRLRFVMEATSTERTMYADGFIAEATVINRHRPRRNPADARTSFNRTATALQLPQPGLWSTDFSTAVRPDDFPILAAGAPAAAVGRRRSNENWKMFSLTDGRHILSLHCCRRPRNHTGDTR